MPFWCPKCSTATLEIADVIRFAPDNRSDDICLQVIRCTRCAFRGAAVYQESRRGRLDTDHSEHTGHRLGGDDLGVILDAIRACPNPRDAACRCAAHILLGRRSFGRWVGLRGFDLLDSFPMRREALK